jgi:AcrR family transcriptional regulator
MATMNKDDTYWSVLNAAIALDFAKGHQRWTMSELSRSSKVTRSLIYYYFGKSKENILTEAVKLMGEEVFGLNPARRDLWSKGEIAESVVLTRALLEKSPHIMAFYMVHRTAETEIGKSLRELETEYFKKLKRFFPTVNETSIEALFCLFLGLVIAPTLSEEAARTAVAVVSQLATQPTFSKSSPPSSS